MDNWARLTMLITKTKKAVRSVGLRKGRLPVVDRSPAIEMSPIVHSFDGASTKALRKVKQGHGVAPKVDDGAFPVSAG